MLRATWITAASVVVIGLLLAGLAIATAKGESQAYCAEEMQTFPPLGIHGWRGEQLENAAIIVRTAQGMGLERDGQILGVMAAMGESSLRNIDYGDWETSGVTNPDGSRTTSIGLFQQQDGWGSREARLDPYSAATIFYRAMLARVPDRAELEPTLVAHRTQVNTDPQHYARYWDRAVRVVAALNGAPLDGDSIEGITLCPAQP